MPTWSRRAVLAAGLAAVTAGCAGSGSDETPTEQRSGGTAGGEEDGRTENPTQSDDATLDLREANVVGVDVTAESDRYTFDVTLHHDDEGEDGYANWWQVERPDGTRLGRRELLHPHAQQPFTRSDSYDLPANVSCVVVRGHDETHGYGGHAMLVDPSSGATRSVAQGRDRNSLAAAECPS